MDKERREFYVIAKETGEIINTIKEGDSVHRKESKEAIEGKMVNFNKGESFIKVYEEGMKKVRGKLANAQYSFLWCILPQMEFNSNILRNDDGTIMSIKDFSEVTGMKYHANRKLLLSLVERGILGVFLTGSRDKRGEVFECYVVNPYIFHKGTLVDNGLLELFEKTGWKD